MGTLKCCQLALQLNLIRSELIHHALRKLPKLTRFNAL